MITVKKVTTKKEIKDFLDFPLKLYKNCPYFVPPLYADEKKMFNPNYVYCDQADHVCFNCYKDGKMAGRIQCINQKASNLKWQQKRIRFTRFDSIDDQDVANALFDVAFEYAKSLGMTEVVGPLGFSDLEREGLLIKGFDQLATFEEQYNYEYYQKLIENYGFTKEVDWTESQLRNSVRGERLERLSEFILKKNKLHFGKVKSTREFLKKYGDAFFDILDETYYDIYGTVPFTDGMKKMMISNFKLIIDIKYVSVLCDETGRVVCFGLCFPAIGKAVQKSGGHLTLPCLIRVLKELKHPKVIDLALIGVLDEYKMKGVSSVLLSEFRKMLSAEHIEYCETNLNLEHNQAIKNQWKNFDETQHKRRRAYVMEVR